MQPSVMIPVNQLIVNPEYKNLFPPLADPDFDDLCRSVAEVGILCHLIVERTGDRYTILSGHHRYEAAIRAKYGEVPCSIATTLEEKIAALFDNVHRRHLSPHDQERLRQCEADWKRKALQRLIPELQALIPYLPGEIKLTLAAASPERQRAYLTELQQRLTAHSSSAAPVAPAAEQSSLIHDLRQQLQEKQLQIRSLNDQITALQQTLKQAKSLATTLTSKQKAANATVDHAVQSRFQTELEDFRQRLEDLSKQLQAAHKDKETLEEQLQQERNRIKAMEAEVKAAALQQQQAVDRFQDSLRHSPGPELLSNGLDCASQILATLAVYAKTITTWSPGTPDQAAKTLRKVEHQLGLLQEAVSAATRRGRDAHPLGNGTPTLSVVGAGASKLNTGRPRERGKSLEG